MASLSFAKFKGGAHGAACHESVNELSSKRGLRFLSVALRRKNIGETSMLRTTLLTAVTTAFTLSLEAPEKMREAAQANAHRPLLKLNLGTADDIPRLQAVREGAPHSTIIVDANEGWRLSTLQAVRATLVEAGVALIEQPLPESDDSALAGSDLGLPLCADESCHTTEGLDRLAEIYDVINIKLDKTGGLTEALTLKQQALEAGLGIMVGCMVASSLAMAPAILLAQGADIVDLDGQLLLAEDRPDPLLYDADGVHPSTSKLWG